MKYFAIIISLVSLQFVQIGIQNIRTTGSSTSSFQNTEIVSEVCFSKQALQEDFLQMRQTLEKNHTSLYEYTPKGLIDSLMDKNFGMIRDSMSLKEFFVLLNPIVSKIGCGHTNVWMPMSYWKQNESNLFPLQIRLIDDLVVVAGAFTKEEQIPRGSILL